MWRGADNYTPPQAMHHYPPPPAMHRGLPPFGYPLNNSGNAQGLWWSYQERVMNSDHGEDSFPVQPHPSMQIILFDNDMPRESIPRFIEPRYLEVPTPQESRLTQDEQKKALKKLRKEIYNPTPKSISKRLSLYYRDNSKNGQNDNEKLKDEDGKRCAVCLDDFVPKEEVMITPCSHMFHEECIVPWVKSHGQCPVCRFRFSERITTSEREVHFNSNTGNARVGGLFAEDLISAMRAMDEAFERGNRTRYI